MDAMCSSQVKEGMMAGSQADGNVLIWAAASGCKDVFDAKLEALRQARLTENEVTDPSPFSSYFVLFFF